MRAQVRWPGRRDGGMKCYWVSAVVAFGMLASLGLTLGLRAPEPVYAGKPLSSWLDEGYEPMSMALHEIGPAAAPFIFSKLRREDPAYGLWSQYSKIWRLTPA